MIQKKICPTRTAIRWCGFLRMGIVERFEERAKADDHQANEKVRNINHAARKAAEGRPDRSRALIAYRNKRRADFDLIEEWRSSC